MKTINNTLVALAIRGKVGNNVFKKYRQGTIMSKYPDMRKAGCSVQQKPQRIGFATAVLKAKEIMKDQHQKNYYASLPGKGSAWNKILSSLLKG